MLFTVLIVSLILTIAIGISNLTLRQAILSNLAKDSGIAFYQADAGVECGMYQDAILGNFPYETGDTPSVAPPNTFECGDQTMTLDTLVSNQDTSSTNNYRYVPEESLRESTQPCFTISFDKRQAALPEGGYSAVRSSGYSSCAQSPRQVERLLQVTY